MELRWQGGLETPGTLSLSPDPSSHPGTDKHRIFLADDQKEMIRVVVATLENEFQIVGFANNGQDVLQLIPLLQPEVLVLDIVMPLMNGIETARCLKTAGSPIRVVFLTVHEDRDFLDAAVAAGAAAYVLKPHLVTDLAPAIRNVLEGRFFVSPCMQAPDASLGSRPVPH